MDTPIKERGRIVSRLRREEGASMIEFAIVAPLLFVLLFGIIEFGLIMYDQAIITSASIEGARFAASYYTNPNNATNSPQVTCSEVQTYVTTVVTQTKYLISFASPASTVQGCCGPNCSPSSSWPGSLDTPETINGTSYNTQFVTVSYSYKFLVFGSLITLIPKGSVTNPLTLQATTVMLDENQNPT
jgi:Flp pilus assembly protein TadG